MRLIHTQIVTYQLACNFFLLHFNPGKIFVSFYSLPASHACICVYTENNQLHCITENAKKVHRRSSKKKLFFYLILYATNANNSDENATRKKKIHQINLFILHLKFSLAVPPLTLQTPQKEF